MFLAILLIVLAQRPGVPTETSRGLTQSLHANVG
jgi:hypothetical protein